MSDIQNIDAQLLETFGETWQNLCKQASEEKWENEQWREPFELLSAALIYSYNGFTNYSRSRLHAPIRSAEKLNALWEPLLKEEQIPTLASLGGHELFATMHLASSSFRISTALPLIAQSRCGFYKELFKKDKSDWERKNLVNHLRNVCELGCCRESGTQLKDEVAFAIIVAHRDEFGHGEIGRGGTDWKKERKGLFEQLYPCRIFQAQLKLMKLGLIELAQLTK
jgi:hypothetical protein